jgi:hypothetical protein
MSRRLRIWLLIWLCVGGWLLWQRGCDTPLEDIVIDGGAVTVRNQSEDEWRDVRIWVNDHYAGGARSIPPGGFVREPLSRFRAAQGQTFNAAATPVASVVLLAKTPAGVPVRIAWGKPFWH